MAPAITFATVDPPPGSHHNAFRNRQIILGIAAFALPVLHAFSHPPNERWEPVYRWLEAK